MLDLVVFSQHPYSYAPRRFTKEAEKLNLKIQIISYSKVDLNNLPAAQSVILREPDAHKNIYSLRDKILSHYVKSGAKILNDRSYLKWSVLDKIKQQKQFEKVGIPSIKNIKISEAKYPYIAKNKLGSHGSRVFKINDETDLNNVLKTNKLKDLVIQEFQKSGFDLRVIVLCGEVLGVMKRTPKEGEFLSNYSRGGEIEMFKTNPSSLDLIKRIAVKAANHFQLDYVGVDLMMGNDGFWKVLEVNRACQFKGFEKATGVNIASEVVNFLV